MPDTEQNKQSDFMIEKIKERPVNKIKLLRRTGITAAMAVIFGLIACFTFIVLEPVITKLLYPEEEPQAVVFPEESDEMSPEDMLSEDTESPSLQEAVESVISEDEQIQKILDNIKFDKDNYLQLYDALAEYTKDLSKSMVTVTALSSDVDWMNDIYEREGQTYGVIIANNGREYLMLTDWNTIRKAESITVTFCDGISKEAFLKQTDIQTGLAVVSVPIAQIPTDTRKAVNIAVLGSSNAINLLGAPVIAMGCPLGMMDSIEYGMVASTGNSLNVVDANYRLLVTDIYGSSNSTGILFNLRGQIVGIITTNNVNADLKNNITAIGISDLRKLIENMSNGKESAYMGISGVDVTVAANQKMEVPFGAYVREVDMNSPAMLAGIQRGDVIVSFNGTTIEKFNQYTSELLRLQEGDTVKVVVQRLVQDSYQEMEMEITLEAMK